jgi:dolichyl-phosphate mannosyltransferase polypeptide 3
MKRHQAYYSIFILITAAWAYLKVTVDNDYFGWLIDVAPLYTLVTFGCYCLGKLGYDLMTFNDYPQEIGKLEQDIHIAKDDLKRKGFKS